MSLKIGDVVYLNSCREFKFTVIETSLQTTDYVKIFGIFGTGYMKDLVIHQDSLTKCTDGEKKQHVS